MLVTAHHTTSVKATKFDQTGDEWHLGVKAILYAKVLCRKETGPSKESE